MSESQNLYPLTIIQDRYSGVYSGGQYTAWNLEYTSVPEEVSSDDVDCSEFWRENQLPVGKGETPQAALEDLALQLQTYHP